MQRRHFLKLTAGTLAVGAIGGCVSPAVRTGMAMLTTGTGAMDAAAFHAARQFAATPAGRIAYVERGHGPAALFLHGFPLNGFQWRGALERLSPYRRCVAPDFLGMGYTQVATGQSLAPAAQADMLAALLDTLAIDAVDIVANDSGGAVAQLFLVRHPRRVRTLLLTNCDSEPDCPPQALLPVIEMAKRDEFVAQWLGPWLADKDLARSPQGLGGKTFTFPERLTDETITIYLEPLVRASELTHAYAIALEPNVLAGTSAALARSRVPVRIVWGTGDTIFSAASPDYLDRTFGNSRGVLRVPGAKLFFPEEYPGLIADETRRLWGVA